MTAPFKIGDKAIYFDGSDLEMLDSHVVGTVVVVVDIAKERGTWYIKNNKIYGWRFADRFKKLSQLFLFEI